MAAAAAAIIIIAAAAAAAGGGGLEVNIERTKTEQLLNRHQKQCTEIKRNNIICKEALIRKSTTN
jgi:hypothetical protein